HRNDFYSATPCRSADPPAVNTPHAPKPCLPACGPDAHAADTPSPTGEARYKPTVSDLRGRSDRPDPSARAAGLPLVERRFAECRSLPCLSILNQQDIRRNQPARIDQASILRPIERINVARTKGRDGVRRASINRLQPNIGSAVGIVHE